MIAGSLLWSWWTYEPRPDSQRSIIVSTGSIIFLFAFFANCDFFWPWSSVVCGLSSRSQPNWTGWMVGTLTNDWDLSSFRTLSMWWSALTYCFANCLFSSNAFFSLSSLVSIFHAFICSSSLMIISADILGASYACFNFWIFFFPEDWCLWQ